ncbi:MAG: Ig domain-containing protein, partial [Synergistaceae bacterium]|nr:Ig domain-containing protein [Synergistaceae bacterium]
NRTEQNRTELTKFFVFIALALFLSSGTAQAASTYTITIPSTLTVQNVGWNELNGGIQASGTLSSDAKLIITASSDNNFNFVKSGDSTQTVSYDFCASSTDTIPITEWEFTSLDAGGTTKTAGINIEDYSNKPYGTYTETVNFTSRIYVPVTGVTITNAPSSDLFVNTKGTLTATVSPDYATNKTVTWSSSDSDYVSINSTTGEYEVKGTKGYGSATITATAADGKTATCTITGKVTYTSLSVGTVIHVGDTFYVGNVYFNTQPAMSFNNSNGVITLVNNNEYYKFKRGSNGTMPNVTAYKVTNNTDGVYIVSGGGTSTSDKFTIAVHNTN